MPIDSSLYAQIQSPDFLGSYNKGLDIADKMRERKAANADAEKKQALQSAYNAGLTQNPDGSVTHDESKTLKYLADNGLGQEYLASKKQFGDLAAEKQKQQAEVEKRNLDYTGQAIGAAKANPQAWPQIRADFIAKTNADPATIPEQYDPKYIAQTENSLLTVAQRQAQGNSDRDFGLRAREQALRERDSAAKKESDKKTGSKAQFDASGFGKRLEQSEAIFKKLAEAGYDRSDTSAGIGSVLPNVARSAEAVQNDQAERNFVNALLRRESGAAIGKDEFTSAEAQYFPRAGDDPQTIANKAANRQQALETMKAEGGKTYDQVPLVVPTQSNKEKPEPPKQGTKKDGYVFLGGDPANQQNWKKL